MWLIEVQYKLSKAGKITIYLNKQGDGLNVREEDIYMNLQRLLQVREILKAELILPGHF